MRSTTGCQSSWFRTLQEARNFRDELERRSNHDTLARLSGGEKRALAQVAPDRLDGLCLARAYLDSQGEPSRSHARMNLVDRISAAQLDAKCQRQGHEEDGHD